MGSVFLRLWLIASVCWVGLVYWAWTFEAGYPGDAEWTGFAFGPPTAILILGYAIRWAFASHRQR